MQAARPPGRAERGALAEREPFATISAGSKLTCNWAWARNPERRAMEQVNRLPIIGWREWLALPLLGVEAIKVKVDTGARSSALHAFEIECFQRQGKRLVRFQVHPFQRQTQPTIVAEAEVVDHRVVRSSGGHETERPVILTDVILNGERWLVELTLVGRDSMGFRMLLGRQAVRDRFLVDPARSFLAKSADVPDEDE
jgi:hypothetical protein